MFQQPCNKSVNLGSFLFTHCGISLPIGKCGCSFDMIIHLPVVQSIPF
nr:MAG TPA: hypothetical protein [Caudoviricetes sp.]